MESICESLLDRKKRLEAEKQKIQVYKMQLYEKHSSHNTAMLKKSNFSGSSQIPFGWRTLYNYIYKKVFLKLRKKHLPYNKKYERREKADKRIKKNGGRSIEERSESIERREEIGHWEMDTVVGKKRK